MGWEPKLWQTPLGQFVHSFGAEALANELNMHTSAVYHWMKGTAAPEPDTAMRVVELARRNSFQFETRGRARDLTLEDVIFGQRKAVARILEERKEQKCRNRS